MIGLRGDTELRMLGDEDVFRRSLCLLYHCLSASLLYDRTTLLSLRRYMLVIVSDKFFTVEAPKNEER